MSTRKFAFAEEKNVSVDERKKQLRAYAKSKRAAVVNRDVKETLLNENFDKAYQAFFGESIGAGTRRAVFIYISFSSEAPTHTLIERLLDLGHTVVVPRVECKQMTAVQIKKESQDFVRSNYGVLEPLGQAYDGEIHLAVIPFLAVDKQGNRLGYGGGFYDKFLSAHTQMKRMAYGFACQVLESVPVQAFDEKMQCIVTEENVAMITS